MQDFPPRLILWGNLLMCVISWLGIKGASQPLLDNTFAFDLKSFKTYKLYHDVFQAVYHLPRRSISRE